MLQYQLEVHTNSNRTIASYRLVCDAERVCSRSTNERVEIDEWSIDLDALSLAENARQNSRSHIALQNQLELASPAGVAAAVLGPVSSQANL
ncbi:hypothetical protein [Tateyamaria sp. ANG-S1]|uniref:hypothetical protein n=1 Tax=Tateyamaria sp. ANG-S1 TaxID=1577905 RepID=UPI00057DF754|nr:hypothetical protein [Tateyamaria sp. ANG-S1]KIC51357.1 hypothetical protein RA29_05925 [Tateyamaria sp. ANG-S1]